MKKKWKLYTVALLIIGFLTVGIRITLKSMRELIKRASKYQDYYDLTNQWILRKNEGRLLEEYFACNGYKTIAIYGMGELGNRLYEELLKSEKVTVKYGIDSNVECRYSDINVVSINDRLEPVDVIVVTAVFDYENIKDNLINKTDCLVVSLEDVVQAV